MEEADTGELVWRFWQGGPDSPGPWLLLEHINVYISMKLTPSPGEVTYNADS